MSPCLRKRKQKTDDALLPNPKKNKPHDDKNNFTKKEDSEEEDSEEDSEDDSEEEEKELVEDITTREKPFSESISETKVDAELKV